MFESNFGFKREPFRYYESLNYLSANPWQVGAYEALQVNLVGRKGLLLLTGEAGLGKTVLLGKLHDTISSQGDLAFYFGEPAESFEKLLEGCYQQLGIFKESDELSHAPVVTDVLMKSGHDTVFILDDAQKFPGEVLERLFRFASLSNNLGKSLKILLAGDSDLKGYISRLGFERSIVFERQLSPLSESEVASYINKQTDLAGSDRNSLFSSDAISRIAGISRGVPAAVNMICRNALLSASQAGNPVVKREAVDEALRKRSGLQGSLFVEAPESGGVDSEAPADAGLADSFETAAQVTAGGKAGLLSRRGFPLYALSAVLAFVVSGIFLILNDTIENRPGEDATPAVGQVARHDAEPGKTELDPIVSETTLESAGETRDESESVASLQSSVAPVEIENQVETDPGAKETSDAAGAPADDAGSIASLEPFAVPVESKSRIETEQKAGEMKETAGLTRDEPESLAASKPAVALSEEITEKTRVSAAEAPAKDRFEAAGFDIQSTTGAVEEVLPAVREASGEEDQPIPLSFSLGAGLRADDHVLVVKGVPRGAKLSAGTRRKGEWLVPVSEIEDLKLIPARHSDQDFELTIQLKDKQAGQVRSEQKMDVLVKAVADAPVLQIRGAPGDQFTAIPVEINARLADGDGSETLSIKIYNAPESVKFSAGHRDEKGAWVLSRSQLPGFYLTPMENAPAKLELTFVAVATEKDGQSAARTENKLDITVIPAR